MQYLIFKTVLLFTFGIMSCYAGVPAVVGFQGYLTDELG